MFPLSLINSTPKKSQTAGFGVFAGRSFKQDEAVLQSWMTMFLPRNIVQFQDVHNYAFEYNETHLALGLDYGSIINHHESANTKAMRTSFKVRMTFQCANQNIEIYAACMYLCTHTQGTHVHVNTFKATKDIAAGQELFIRYSSVMWFESKNVSYIDVDYASTMWRPDLHPLPCRESVRHTTGADGQHSFTVAETMPSGAVLENSLCVEVSVIVIDQFPYLWDFVLTGETDNEHTGCQQTTASSRAYTACVFCRSRRSKYRRTCCAGSIFNCCQYPNPQSPKDRLVVRVGWPSCGHGV